MSIKAEVFAATADVLTTQGKSGLMNAMTKTGFEKLVEGVLAAAAHVVGSTTGAAAMVATAVSTVPGLAVAAGLIGNLALPLTVAAVVSLAGGQVQAAQRHKADYVIRNADVELGRQAALRGRAKTLQEQAGLGAYMSANAREITNAQAQMKLIDQVQAMGLAPDEKRAAAEKQVVQQQITTAQTHLAMAVTVARTEKLLTEEVKARYGSLLPEPAKYVLNRPMTARTSYTPLVLA